MPPLRVRSRRAFYRSRALRELAAIVRWPRVRGGAPDLAHLAFYEDLPWGPVQRDEALLLHALVRALRPATVVEFGFLRGDSAFNFLRALDPDARLYSFEVDPAAAEFARVRAGHDSRFVLRLRSQDTIAAADVDGREVDFVFLDGAHDLEINKTTFERLVPLLSTHAVVAVHDTGGLPRALTPDWSPALALTERWAGDEFEHQPEERAFANWLLDEHPEFSQIHLHSSRVARHGLTLLQRATRLKRPAQT